MDFLYSLDLLAIFKIILLDIMLGGDNAIVIAMACVALPTNLRTKAIVLGTLGAIVVRSVALAGADALMLIPLLKLIAGIYLMYIGFGLLTGGDEEKPVAAHDKLWGAIKTIIAADLIMSIDNVFAVVAAAQSAGAHSTIYAVAGVIFSIPIIIAGSTLIMGLMGKFPIITWFGGGLLGWVGAEMMITDSVVAQYIPHSAHIFIKLICFLAVILAGYLHLNVYKKEGLQNV